MILTWLARYTLPKVSMYFAIHVVELAEENRITLSRYDSVLYQYSNLRANVVDICLTFMPNFATFE